MNVNISISDAEWEVMNLVWTRAPVSAAEIVAELEQKRGWQSRTTRTLLDRLLRKGALAAGHDGKRIRYGAKIRRDDCIRRESRSFLDRVFGGEPGPMLIRLVKESKLSPGEIRELKRILKQKGD
jgi:BlaI family transcriptional regulator, penicillinase repressor